MEGIREMSVKVKLDCIFLKPIVPPKVILVVIMAQKTLFVKYYQQVIFE